MDENDRYLYLPDPDTEPEPYFAGLSWPQITAELDRLERETWEDKWLAEQWAKIYEENGW